MDDYKKKIEEILKTNPNIDCDSAFWEACADEWRTTWEQVKAEKKAKSEQKKEPEKTK